MSIEKHTVPCEEDVREALSYTPLWAHSFFKSKRNGVPGIGLPRLVINNPIVNVAIPELLPAHGSITLNSMMAQ